MTDPLDLDLDRGERASIVLRADLRRRLPKPAEAPAPSAAVAKGILQVLDSFPPDRCYPSEELIAKCACTTVRTLRRSLTALIAAGLVEVRPRAAKGTRYRSPRFYVIRYDILGSLDYRLPAVVAQASAPANMAAPTSSTVLPRPICPSSTGHNGRQQQARDNRIVKSKQELPVKRTAATVKAEVELAAAVKELTPGLLAFGVARNRVTALILEAGSAARVHEVLALLKARTRSVTVHNPGGFIAQAIRQGWAARPSR